MASGRRSRGKWLRVLLLRKDVGCARGCASANYGGARRRDAVG